MAATSLTATLTAKAADRSPAARQSAEGPLYHTAFARAAWPGRRRHPEGRRQEEDQQHQDARHGEATRLTASTIRR
jgi:hypothetical protein